MDGTEQLIITDEFIYTPHNDHNVMHVCETSIMKKQAEITTKNGGSILEIGFGMHISADFITNNPGVTSYTVIEIHPQQYERALEWAKTKTIPVKVILGDWIDVLPMVDEKFDGVFFDTDTDGRITKFLDHVQPNCKKDTIVSFYAYYVYDARLNPVTMSYTDEEFESMPDRWRNNKHFSSKSYTLYYTTYDGEKFYSDRLKFI
jgi:guanidinoacetate N-methyltransferase